jgi:hypothetical protein
MEIGEGQDMPMESFNPKKAIFSTVKNLCPQLTIETLATSTTISAYTTVRRSRILF